VNGTAIGVLLALGLSCATQTAQEGAAPVPAAVTVLMTDGFKFSPVSVTVHAGDAVRWLNASRSVYTVTTDFKKAKDPKDVSLPINAEPFDSGEILPGGSWTCQFTLPGQYKYFCIQHEEQGMVGEVIVEPGGKPVTAR
jgi:plastocyanin